MRHLRAVTTAAVVVCAATLAIGCGTSGGAAGPAGTPPGTASASSSPAAVSHAPDMLAVAPGWPATAASDFATTIDNPWFPLVKGRTWVSVGVKDGRPTVDTYTVTGRTRQIMGVTASVIRDRLTTRGKVIEATWDWYAQDEQGNVWYLGEDTKEYDAAGKVIWPTA